MKMNRLSLSVRVPSFHFHGFDWMTIEQALVAGKRSREAQTLEKLGHFKNSLGAFLTSVQPVPKELDKECELSRQGATAGSSTAMSSTGSLTENGLQKGFLTETLDDYDDRFGLSFLINSTHSLIDVIRSGWRENTLVFSKQPRKEAPNYDNHYMVLDPMKDKKEGKRNTAKLSKWEKGGPLL